MYMSAEVRAFSRTLVGYVKLKLKLRCLTGLLIRMPVHAQVYRIGGADQYPMTTRRYYEALERTIEVPYIPGSSVKGRMRGLLELSLGLDMYTTDEKIWQHVRSLRAMGIDRFADDARKRVVVSELFGWAAANYAQIKEALEKQGHSKEEARKEADEIFEHLTITRLSFSDFYPSEKFISDRKPESIADFLEEKSENRIDRITSAADPRHIVRVAPEVEFEGTITCFLFDNDRECTDKYLRTIATGMQLIEDTYLGASGSRGYGRIELNNITIEVFKMVRSDGYPRIDKVGSASFNSLRELMEDLSKVVELVRKLYE